MEIRESLQGVRLRLRAHRAQGAGLAVGRRRAVRRVRRLCREPRALALYRRDARGQTADGGGVRSRLGGHYMVHVLFIV
jgi:hypothetical protein